MKNPFKRSPNFFKKNNPVHEIEPDEVFIDSSNLPEFDTHQFEGHLEKPISKKIIVLTSIVFLLTGTTFLVRAGELQIINRSQYEQLSKQNHLGYEPIFAERGLIEDRKERKLAWNIPNPKEGNTGFSTRKYSDKPGMGHLLGYVKYPAKDDKDNYYRKEFKGEDGVEEVFNEKLNGENGLKIVEKNALSKIQSETTLHPPESGESIELSIDAEIQSILNKFIKETAKRSKFNAGAGVIMNVENGNILSMTNYPEYDPEVLSQGDPANKIKKYQKSERKPFMNRAVSGLYTPGSIVKPFIALAALTEGVITPEKEILSTGSISVPNPYHPDKETVFNDWKAHGRVNMREAIAVSSNVYFYETGGGYKDQEGLGIENIQKYMKKIGFSEKTGIILNNEKAGLIPSPEWKKETFNGADWFLGDTYNTSIGQYGFQVTPLQMAKNTAFIANEGKILTPSVLKDKKRESKTIEDIPKKNFRVVKEGMRKAVEEGTATGLNVGYMDVAAKTGTAELTTKEGNVNSWVIGFFPYDDPKYSFAIVMEKGEYLDHIGGVYVMRRFLDQIYREKPEFFEKL